ncbi:DUF3276 family protein [Mangrovibacterium lignilyticum]|uniref:DUF3276 family protein n=1 Tax=Mangrovibacterium lignilyticum TaxID=2668052 RepID=UPI0013D72C39|nr:DUF3276 family protein [Mangrovibacterium lignilyticum]
MEGFEKNEELNEEMDSKFRQEIYSKAVRAGKRTYFFDVKSTRKDEYYLTITESKKRYDQDGKFHFEKHKIFLYKEDFEKFADGLNEVVDFIVGNQPLEYSEEDNFDQKEEYQEELAITDTVDLDEEIGVDEEEMVKNYTDVEFEDLSN